MIWDPSRWLVKVAASFGKFAFEVFPADSGNCLGEATFRSKSLVAALLLDSRASSAWCELREKGNPLPCLTVSRGFTLRLIVGPIVAGGNVQITDENKNVVATFKGRPLMLFRGLELLSPSKERLGRIRIVVKPFRPPGVEILEPGGGLVGRVEWQDTATGHVMVAEKYANDLALKKTVFGVMFGYQMLRAW